MSSVYGIGTLSPPILFKVPCRVYRDGEVRERPKKEADGPRSGRLAHEAARGGWRLMEPRRGHAPENEAGCVCVCGGESQVEKVMLPKRGNCFTHLSSSGQRPVTGTSAQPGQGGLPP